MQSVQETERYIREREREREVWIYNLVFDIIDFLFFSFQCCLLFLFYRAAKRNPQTASEKEGKTLSHHRLCQICERLPEFILPQPPERMSVRAGGGGGGGKGNNGISTIPASSRKMVQSLKEIVNNLCTEQEIYFTLKECNMDPDEAVNRLLSQGPWLWLLSNLHLYLSIFYCFLFFTLY